MFNSGLSVFIKELLQYFFVLSKVAEVYLGLSSSSFPSRTCSPAPASSQIRKFLVSPPRAQNSACTHHTQNSPRYCSYRCQSTFNEYVQAVIRFFGGVGWVDMVPFIHKRIVTYLIMSHVLSRLEHRMSETQYIVVVSEFFKNYSYARQQSVPPIQQNIFNVHNFL